MPPPTATLFLPYHALDAVVQRGTRAAQPAASAVVPGTLYSVTDEGARLERSDGSAWALYAPTGADGGGGGAPDPHATTHQPGGSDVLQVSAASRVLGAGPRQRGAMQELTLGDGLGSPGRNCPHLAPAIPRWSTTPTTVHADRTAGGETGAVQRARIPTPRSRSSGCEPCPPTGRMSTGG